MGLSPGSRAGISRTVIVLDRVGADSLLHALSRGGGSTPAFVILVILRLFAARLATIVVVVWQVAFVHLVRPYCHQLCVVDCL